MNKMYLQFQSDEWNVYLKCQAVQQISGRLSPCMNFIEFANNFSEFIYLLLVVGIATHFNIAKIYL